jgi:ketosteroid isomerase-like protein
MSWKGRIRYAAGPVSNDLGFGALLTGSTPTPGHLREKGKSMPSANPTQPELNKEVVRRFYEAVLRVPGGPDFATIKELTDEQEIELNWGHPDSGVYRGAAIGLARHRMHELTGLDISAISIDELIADGPTRVVVVATNSGTDIHGNPWRMTVLELVDVVHGKITKKRSFYQDTALLRDISLEREAALAQKAGEA